MCRLRGSEPSFTYGGMMSLRGESRADAAGGVAEDRRPGFQPGRGRRPAVPQPGIEEFVGRRPVVPDGDRRQLAESPHAERQPLRGAVWGEQIVTEFVLLNQVEGREIQLTGF